jgi:O-antigen ligase
LAIARDTSVPSTWQAASDRVLWGASAAFLVLVAFASSAGLRAGALTLAGLALCVGLRESLRTLRAGFPRDVAAAGAAWLALCAVSTAWSVDPAFTRGELKSESFYALLAVVVFFVAAARHPEFWPRWWIALMAGGALAFLAELLQDTFGIRFSRHDVDGGSGPYSTHLVLLLPLLFALDWTRPWGRERRPRLLVFALLLLFAAAWYTGNRIMWLAFAAQLAVGMATWRKLGTTQADRASVLRRLAAVTGIAIAVAFAASMAERYERDINFVTGVDGGLENDLRPLIWKRAWETIGEAPWLGHGFGREIAAPAFIPLTPPQANHPILMHGHNTFLDVAIQLGAVGVAVFVVLLALLARRYLAMLADPDCAPLGMMGLALLAGFLVKNLTDDFFHRHNALVFWALNAMLLGLAASRRARA